MILLLLLNLERTFCNLWIFWHISYLKLTLYIKLKGFDQIFFYFALMTLIIFLLFSNFFIRRLFWCRRLLLCVLFLGGNIFAYLRQCKEGFVFVQLILDLILNVIKVQQCLTFRIFRYFDIDVFTRLKLYWDINKSC